MKVLLALVCALVSAQAVPHNQVGVEKWQTWKVSHGKNYSHPVEEEFRMKIFMDNMAKIENHNDMANRGEISYFLGMNRFGDLVSNCRYNCNFYDV